MVVGILGVLVAITLPALSGARGQARTVSCLSNLRGLSTATTAYLGHSRDRYPFITANLPRRLSPPDDAEQISLQPGVHWNLRRDWPALMHEVAPWREWFRTWVCPGSPRDPAAAWVAAVPGIGSFDRQSSYTYCHGFFARPEVWAPGTTADPALLAAVSVGDVAFPARKVMFFDSEMAHLPPNADKDNRPMLFADGHAALHRVSQAAKPVVNPFTKQAKPLHDTALGVRGYDY